MNRRLPRLAGEICLAATTVALVAWLWELAARHSSTWPTLWAVGRGALELLSSGVLLEDVAASLRRAVCGFLLGGMAGVLLGLFTGRVAAARASLGLILHLIRSIPGIALVPFVLLWFGIGEFGKIFLVAWGVIFPVWLYTHLGARNVDIRYVWTARTMGVGRLGMLARVVFPACLPAIVAGLRVASALSFMMLTAAEMAGADSGLGYRIWTAHLVFRTDYMVTSLLTLAVLAAVADQFFALVLRRLVAWTPSQRE